MKDDRISGWICHIQLSLQDLLLCRLDGVYKDRDAALDAIGDTLAKIDWGNILERHGRALSGMSDGKYLDNITCHINVNPRGVV